MTLAEFKEWADITTSILTSMSLIIGGIWVFYRFVLQQERYPNINFSTDINVIGRQDNFLIVELLAFVENKGKAQHKMQEFGFDLNAIYTEDKIISEIKWGGQVDFPHRLTFGSYLPQHQGFFFVDPGTTAKYSYITNVPINATFLLLHSNFVYANRKGYMHTAEKTICLTK